MKSLKSSKGGFTLIELMVSVVIFVLLTSLMVVKYSNFNSGTVLTNLAYDVALTIRTAQSYGVSVRGDVSTQSSDFNGSYGVYFSKVNTSCTSNTKYSLRRYTTSGELDKGCNGQTYSSYSLKRGAKIKEICLGDSVSDMTCNFSYVTIKFNRPDPGAKIYPSFNEIYRFARIKIESADGSSIRNIDVRSNGQISVPL